jgi:hypothetical protein|tara:strand:- start:47 stop:190 length:144 start_codon:yes stop_codon:yes gene_type:complete
MKVIETTPNLAENRTGDCSKLPLVMGEQGSGAFTPLTGFSRHLPFFQ